MRRITKLGLTLGVLAVASFLAPGKSYVYSAQKRSVVCGVCLHLLCLPPPSMCMCIHVDKTLWQCNPQLALFTISHASLGLDVS